MKWKTDVAAKVYAPMPVKVNIAEQSGTYYITFTCYKWLYLLQKVNAYDAVYKWFDHLVNKGHYITGYVIMPNHIHTIISFRNTSHNPSHLGDSGLESSNGETSAGKENFTATVNFAPLAKVLAKFKNW